MQFVVFESNLSHCLGGLSTLHWELQVVVPSWGSWVLQGNFLNFVNDGIIVY
jgi:hypothetical protein